MNNVKNPGSFRVRAAAAVSIAVFAANLTGAPSAHASEPVLVHFGDLNVHSAAGAQVLLRRINWAATKACGTEPYIFDLGEQRRFHHCRIEAVDRAVRKVDSPMLDVVAGHVTAPVTLAER
jgi:UrcA family protein